MIIWQAIVAVIEMLFTGKNVLADYGVATIVAVTADVMRCGIRGATRNLVATRADSVVDVVSDRLLDAVVQAIAGPALGLVVQALPIVVAAFGRDKTHALHDLYTVA